MIKKRTIKTGVKGLWSKISNPVETLTSAYDSFKTQISSIYENLQVLTGYEGAKGGSYTATNISLSTADPAGKVIKLAGGAFLSKIFKYVNVRLLESVRDVNATIGKNGPTYASREIKTFNDGSRIDVENPHPGQRPGQLHYQNGDGNKYYFNFEDLQFHIKESNGLLPSNTFQKSLLENDEILKAIVKGKKFLDGK